MPCGLVVSYSPMRSALKMETVSSSETLVSTSTSTRRYNPEHQHRRNGTGFRELYFNCEKCEKENWFTRDMNVPKFITTRCKWRAGIQADFVWTSWKACLKRPARDTQLMHQGRYEMGQLSQYMGWMTGVRFPDRGCSLRHHVEGPPKLISVRYRGIFSCGTTATMEYCLAICRYKCRCWDATPSTAWRQGTAYPLCAMTLRVAAFPSPIHTQPPNILTLLNYTESGDVCMRPPHLVLMGVCFPLRRPSHKME
jgi:hypothetical protein